MATNSLESAVIAHYQSSGDPSERLLEAARGAAKNPAQISQDDLSPFDQMHSRGREASEELVELLDPLPGAKLLDLGSGLGGATRIFVQRRGVQATGLDLTPLYVAAANTLSKAVGLADLCLFVEGDATRTGLEKNSFDCAMTHHAAMNIADKAALYAEAYRVLKPGGRFLIYDVMAVPGAKAPDYPMPWASSPDFSFLETPQEVSRLLQAVGFRVTGLYDEGEKSALWFADLRARLANPGPNPHPRAADQTRLDLIFGNLQHALTDKRVTVVKLLCTK